MHRHARIILEKSRVYFGRMLFPGINVTYQVNLVQVIDSKLANKTVLIKD